MPEGLSKIEQLKQLLTNHRRVDFSAHSDSSLQSCVQERIEHLKLTDVEHYIDYFQAAPAEFDHFLNCLRGARKLTVVDPFIEALIEKYALPRLKNLQKLPVPYRIWSIGCALGMEPFALTVMLAQQIGIAAVQQKIKLFATDSSEQRLSQARLASFESPVVNSLPNDLAGRYFQPAPNHQFSFKYELRRSIIFGKHDVSKDPVISRIDLLLSQNSLLDYDRDVQPTILERLASALNEGGVLILGDSETAATEIPGLEQLEKRVFRRVANIAKNAVEAHEDHAGAEAQLTAAGFEFMPLPQLIVDSGGMLAAANQKARTVFSIPLQDVGRPFKDLEISYRPLELRSVIEQAYAKGEMIITNRVQKISSAGRSQIFDVFVSPLQRLEHGFAGCAVQFYDITDLARLQDEISGLNQQLQTANEELQAAHEELETTNEELQSTNEELQTTNEELQSTNEELETMNEELQSSNAELELTNAEQRQLTANASQTSSFLDAILGSIESALMVVDSNMRVLVWNLRCSELWGFKSMEAVGKRIGELDSGLPAEEMIDAIANFKARGLKEGTAVIDALDKTGRSLRCTFHMTALPFASELATILIAEIEKVHE